MLALATFAVGRHEECLTITRPFYQAYAHRHGYAYIEGDGYADGRPPSWGKVPLLMGLLRTYDAVLWIDCDVVIVDGTDDIATQVPEAAVQAMTVHTHHLGFCMGEVPSCGVWLVRKPMVPVLEQVWGMTQYVEHPWWEQAAMHELLGYLHNGRAIFPVTKGETTPLRERTNFLDESWNSIDVCNEKAAPRFMHMAGMRHEERMRWMQYWAERAMCHAA